MLKICRRCAKQFEKGKTRDMNLCTDCLTDYKRESIEKFYSKNGGKSVYLQTKNSVSLETRNERRSQGICVICGKQKIFEGSKSRCANCVARMNKNQNRYSWMGRLILLMKMGGKCVQCGNQDLRVLEIDHVQSYHHRKRGLDWLKFSHLLKVSEKAREELYEQFKKGEVRILCRNCQRIKSFYEMGSKAAFDEALESIKKADMVLEAIK